MILTVDSSGRGAGDTGSVPSLLAKNLRAHGSDLVAIAVVLCFAVVPFPAEVFRAQGFLLILALLPAAGIPLRRRWPIQVLALTLGCTFFLALLGVLAPSALIALAIVSYSVTERTPRLLGSTCVGATALVVFAVSALPLEGELLDSRALQFVMFIILAGALGDAARSRREYITAVTERAERAEKGREEEARRRVAEERVRIARDLHDLVAHQIAVISLSAGVASSSLATQPEKAQEALTNIRTASRTVLADIGVLMALLRAEDAGEQRDLEPQPGLNQLEDLLSRFAEVGLQVNMRRESGVTTLSPAADHVAYLALQEGLTNAQKHGEGQRAEVDIHMLNGAVVLAVSNPLRQNSVPPGPGGHGLRGMRERVGAVRGRVETARSDGQFQLTITVPTGEVAPK